MRTFPPAHRGTGLVAALVLAAGCALAATAPPAPARLESVPAVRQVVFSIADIADAMPDGLAPAGFAGSDGDSALSPARCRIKNVHVLDPDTLTVLARQAKPKEVTNQSLIQA